MNLPCLRAGSIAVHPNGETRVQVGVEGLERILESRRQRGERLLGVAARRGARAANGRTGGCGSIILCWIGSRVIGFGLVGVSALLPCCRRGDATGQSDGGDERDDGFVEEHCKE